MMNFLNVALRNARRGFRVHPLNGKDAILKNWPNVATTAEETIRAWAVKYPDYNVGVAGGPDVVIVDSDRVSRLKELSGPHGAEWFNTYSVTSGRPDRAHFYYLMTDEVREFGNKKWAEPGQAGNVFEVKVHGGQVVAEGSIHPVTGEVYRITQDLPLIPFPAGLIVLMRDCYGKTNSGKRERVPREKIGEGGRHDALVREAGAIQAVTEMSKAVLTAHLQDFNEQYLDPPLSDEEVQSVAMSCNWKPNPQVTIGKSTPVDDMEVVVELDEALRATPLPDYPLAPFEGTLYLEFAKRASAGNFIPLHFFIEGAMTFVGAVCGNNLQGFAPEITARLYTVLLACAGAGKGTTFRRIRSIVPPCRLFRSVNEKTLPRPCSALVANPASENGLNDALLQHAATILCFEEMDKLMEKTQIQGSGNSLMSIIRGLFDDVVPEITTCKGRPVAAEYGLLSLLGAMTPNLWRRSMEGADSYGTGLGGRFNLVATTEDRVAPSLMPMDLGELHETLEQKLSDLEAAPQMNLRPDKHAFKVMDEWWGDNFKGQQHFNRVNVITHRKAVHLAWIRGMPVITAELMRHAISLAEYLVAVRDAFQVTKGEDRTAIGENRVLHILTQINPNWVRASKIVELLDGVMSRASVFRALNALVDSGEAEKRVLRDKQSGRPYAVYRVSLK